MKLLYVSDIHHLDNYPQEEVGYKSIFKQMDNNLVTLSKILKQEEFDLLLVGGDLSEDGDVVDYESVLEVIKPYDCILTLGNHDIKENFYQAFYAENRSDKFHKVYYRNQYCIISFDNSQHGVNDGLITNSDLEFLEKTLKANLDYELIVLMHHHLFEAQHDTKAVNNNLIVRKLLEKYQVQLVLTAHTHTPFLNKVNQTTYITSGSLAFRAHVEDNDLIFNNERSYVTIDLINQEAKFKSLVEEVIEYGRFKLDEKLMY